MALHDPDPPAPPVGARAVAELVTIESFLLARQPAAATGVLTSLLDDIALAGNLIANRTRRAGLTEMLGASGDINPQGEEQQQLDVYADDVMTAMLARGGRVCAMLSEERQEPTIVRDGGRYVVVHDPLDGSRTSTPMSASARSSVSSSATAMRLVPRRRGRLVASRPRPRRRWLHPLRHLDHAGLQHRRRRPRLHAGPRGGGVRAHLGRHAIPTDPGLLQLQPRSSPLWDQGVGSFVEWLNRPDSPRLSQRSIGSAVADFHRNLLHGGICGYPAETGLRDGKLRLLYEAAPLAYMAEQAGGLGSGGRRRLLDIEPDDVHERTPVFVDDHALVTRLQQMIEERSGI